MSLVVLGACVRQALRLRDFVAHVMLLYYTYGRYDPAGKLGRLIVQSVPRRKLSTPLKSCAFAQNRTVHRNHERAPSSQL